MAQTGFTPILIYSSTTASQAPAAGSLTNSTLGSELAINITDGKLFYKDNANAIQVIAWKVTPTTAGGTGLTSYTAGDMVYWASGTTFTKLAIGASGYWMSSSGTAPQWNAPAALTKTDDTNVTLTLGGSASTALLNAASLTLGWTGQLAATRGGTGFGSYAVGDLLYADTTTTLAKLADVATGNALISGGVGVAPSWGKIGLTTHVSGTLPVTNGGTGTATAFTAGSVVFAGASGVYSQNNSKLFWDNTNSRLGIGTASPGRPLTIEAAATAGPSAQNPSIRLNDTTSGRPSVIDYDSNQVLTIWNIDTGIAGADIVFRYGSGSGTEGLRLVNNGNMKLANGNFIPSTAAKGVNFTANTPAAGMTSQLLNWYEEGTWTPVLYSGATDATMSGNTSGRYTRIGRVVHIHLYIETTNLNGIGGGVLAIKNLPFTVNSGFVGYAAATAGYAGNLAITAGQSVALRPNAAATTLGVLIWSATTGTTDMTGTQWTNTGYVGASFSYLI